MQLSLTTSGSTSSFTYDAAGNLINDGVHTYQYDGESRLRTVDGGSTAAYAYDYANRRFRKSVGTSVTHYIWQGAQILAEHNGANGAVLADYIYPSAALVAKVANGTTNYYLSDRMSPRMVLDANANVIGRQGHLPFGEDFGESGQQEKHHFTTYESDAETGANYAMNRSYSPSLGKFMSVDHKRGAEPRGSNAYAYAQNTPTYYVDRDGRDGIIIIFGQIFLMSCHSIVFEHGDLEDGGSLDVKDDMQSCDLISLGGAYQVGQPTSDRTPCQGVAGFTSSVGGYSADDMNKAALTIFGELSQHFNEQTKTEAEYIASIILNRAEAIANGTAPSAWGDAPTLTSVVSAPGQFSGLNSGDKLARSGIDMNEGERNCSRLQAAGSAINYLAGNSSARHAGFFYMCAHGHNTRAMNPDTDVEINGNIFSPTSLGCTP